MSATSVVTCFATWSAVTGYPRSLLVVPKNSSVRAPSGARDLRVTRLLTVVPPEHTGPAPAHTGLNWPTCPPLPESPGPVGPAVDWSPDLLGADYRRRDLPLGSDPDGEGLISATLVRHESAPSTPWQWYWWFTGCRTTSSTRIWWSSSPRVGSPPTVSICGSVVAPGAKG